VTPSSSNLATTSSFLQLGSGAARPRGGARQQTRGGQQRKPGETDAEFVRRNMLMNIILRPGGGDRARALPRPKVEVNSEGANVIVVKLTFPDNENIQGLRAFTPTDPVDLAKFAELRSAIASEEASVEQITAVSGKPELRAIVANPTRPPRPEKLRKSKPTQTSGPAPHVVTKSKNNGFSFRQPKKTPSTFIKHGGISHKRKEVVNMVDSEQEDSAESPFFKFEVDSDEISEEVSRIKPRAPQDPPPPPPQPSSFEKGGVGPRPFRPSPTLPARPPRPAKERPPGVAPPRPRGPPPRLPASGVQLTRTGQRHPVLRVQSRSFPGKSLTFPKLKKAWRLVGRRQ